MTATVANLSAFRTLQLAIKYFDTTYGSAEAKEVAKQALDNVTGGVWDVHNRLDDIDVSILAINAGE